jgi:hypothetical protein
VNSPSALILRSGCNPRLEGCFSVLWIILRDAAMRLLRMRAEVITAFLYEGMQA